MNISAMFKGLITVATVAGSVWSQAAHLPSPCASGESGSGTNCMYLVAGNGAANIYDGVSGDREATTGLSMAIDVWMDFGENAVQGGGFDIVFDTTGAIFDWAWNTTDFPASEQTRSGTQTAAGWQGIQFDDIAGNGYGGSTGTQPAFALVGTLTVTVSSPSQLVFSISQPYTDATFPNCFAPGAGSGGSGCVPTDFYDLSVTAVPLPGAAWLMLGAVASLCGFGRKRGV